VPLTIGKGSHRAVSKNHVKIIHDRVPIGFARVIVMNKMPEFMSYDAAGEAGKLISGEMGRGFFSVNLLK